MYALLRTTAAVCAAMALSMYVVTTAQAADSSRPLITFGQAVGVVSEYFAAHRCEPKDLISQGQVKEVLNLLAEVGWKVNDGEIILSTVLPDDDFIVKKLRSKEGIHLMRQISRYPLGYDRLERMARLPRGHLFVMTLIEQPGGYKMIEYMAEQPGGMALGNMLSQIPSGVDFNKPTGHLYTVDGLLARLKISYEAAMLN